MYNSWMTKIKQLCLVCLKYYCMLKMGKKYRLNRCQKKPFPLSAVIITDDSLINLFIWVCLCARVCLWMKTWLRVKGYVSWPDMYSNYFWEICHFKSFHQFRFTWSRHKFVCLPAETNDITDMVVKEGQQRGFKSEVIINLLLFTLNTNGGQHITRVTANCCWLELLLAS